MTDNMKYDVVVIGAGHAGVEAGLASARKGLKTLMLTINLDNIAFMPCNPSVGGPAKGIVVREVDALGGQMAKILQGMVDEMIVEDGEVKGVRTNIGTIYEARAVIVTTGTFLRGEIILGDLKYSSGPNHQMPSVPLADQMKDLGFDIVRFNSCRAG